MFVNGIGILLRHVVMSVCFSMCDHCFTSYFSVWSCVVESVCSSIGACLWVTWLHTSSCLCRYCVFGDVGVSFDVDLALCGCVLPMKFLSLHLQLLPFLLVVHAQG